MRSILRRMDVSYRSPSRPIRTRRTPPELLVWDAMDIVAATGLSRNEVYELMRSGAWGPPIRAGRRLFVQRRRVEAWARGEAS